MWSHPADLSPWKMHWQNQLKKIFIQIFTLDARNHYASLSNNHLDEILKLTSFGALPHLSAPNPYTGDPNTTCDLGIDWSSTAKMPTLQFFFKSDNCQRGICLKRSAKGIKYLPYLRTSLATGLQVRLGNAADGDRSIERHP